MADESKSRNSEASIEVHWKASVEFRFWLHDPEGDGMCYFRTAADRDAYAKKAIAGYCDDTWAEEVEGVVGGEVTHVATRVNEKQRPPDDEIDEDGIDGDGMYWGDSEIQSQCGYELAPIAPVSERGTLPFKLPLRVEHIAYEGDWFRDANDEPVDADTIAKIINERLCERNSTDA